VSCGWSTPSGTLVHRQATTALATAAVCRQTGVKKRRRLAEAPPSLGGNIQEGSDLPFGMAKNSSLRGD
jgi:hypothetical protein